MKNKIIKAFKDYDNGARPNSYGKPKFWYVLSKENKIYPAKIIWALAIKEGRTRSFNSIDARRGFEKYGFLLVDVSKSIDEGRSFSKSVKAAKRDSSKERNERLALAKKTPETIYSIVKNYRRNPDVVAEVIYRAKGICGRCQKPAPFRSRTKGNPLYLEVHHIKQLAYGGEDKVENAIALCPNCHREEHFGMKVNVSA